MRGGRREPCCWVSWDDVFQLRFGLVDHCLVHRSTLGTQGSSWSSCQHHLSQRNNGRGSADVQEVPWVRARLAEITLFWYTSWETLPSQGSPGTGTLFIPTITSATMSVLPLLWIMNWGLSCIPLFYAHTTLEDPVTSPTSHSPWD